MADDEGIINIYRIREVTGIGTPHVFPKSRVAKKKKSQDQEEGDYLEKTEEESPKSGQGIDIEA
ncbi:MAG TPA: hypothetical protein VEJ88_01305 [Dissulfurispiraceae bacterium]|nr:hypothetical protein [Dissulfurispiraceae bacterium]